jgi:LuxR family maltose regulon positive regulatory protein
LLFDSLGEDVQALAALTQALALAEPEGFRRIFLDEGQSMAHLLYRALEAEISPEYVGDLLAAFTAEAAPVTANTDLIEPLTAREVEVLHLIAYGCTNREIGQQLSISLGTVKRHTANINGKLNVHNRTQAVAYARTLGILSD